MASKPRFGGVVLLIGAVAALAAVAVYLSPGGGAPEETGAEQPAPEQPAPDRAKAVQVALVYSGKYLIDLGGLEQAHPFDIRKYDRIYRQLVAEGVVDAGCVHQPGPISEEDILRVHTDRFLESLADSRAVAAYLEAPEVGLVPAPLVEQGILSPFRHATGGTLLAARKALDHGIGINLGGGYHHAKPSAGEGFCIYADMPIAIRVLQAEGRIRTALVIDLDVHQGNGTAVCLAGDESTFTFSVHQGNIYPVPKERSDLDVELQAGMGDDAYLELLAAQLPKVFQAAGKPDIVFYQAGCDTLAGDPLASLQMSEEGIVERDRMVIDACVRRGVPVVMALGGGYSPDAWHAQYASIRGIVEEYGLATEEASKEAVDYGSLDQSKVISLARAAATREGYKLEKYQPPKVRFDEEDRQWWVSFEMHPPTPPGGHFGVLIDVDEKEITVLPGE
jgi:histone deacetylase 11